MNKTLSLLAIVLATAATSFAGTAVSSKKVVVAPADDSRFRAKEWQVDAAVVGAGGTYNSNSGQGIGGGLGVNYFFSQYFGVGVDNSVGGYEKVAGHGAEAVDSLQADLIARYPISSWNLAPYAMIGGGANWGSATQGDGNVGAGLEYRFTPNFGIFGDCRWLYGGNTGGARLSMALPRVGVRFAF
ncbi:MAG: hypothetical protein ACH346_00420 [Chthoniobacterales bacterium]